MYSQAMAQRAVPADFERALSDEILASELLRMRVLAGTLAVLLVGVEILLFSYYGLAQSLARQRISLWLPLKVLGPFLLYQCLAMVVLTPAATARGRHRHPAALPERRRRDELADPGRAASGAHQPATGTSAVASARGPSLLYFIFIVRVDAALAPTSSLPVVHGPFVVRLLGYSSWLYVVLPVSTTPQRTPMLAPLSLTSAAKAAILLVSGVAAGFVARAPPRASPRPRVRRARKRILGRVRPARLAGGRRPAARARRERAERGARRLRHVPRHPRLHRLLRAAHARRRWSTYLNTLFDVDDRRASTRHHGIVNKFLGDGFMAVLRRAASPTAATAANAVEAGARDRRPRSSAWSPTATIPPTRDRHRPPRRPGRDRQRRHRRAQGVHGHRRRR